MALALLAAVADVLTPLYAGKLIDAVASGAPATRRSGTGHDGILAAGRVSLGAMLLRQAVYYSIIGFTLRMMNGMMSSAFHRVAPVHRLARQQLRRFDRAQDHARHVGGRPAQRHAADRPCPRW